MISNFFKTIEPNGLETRQFEDGRGCLQILYEENGITLKRSTSKKNTLRGLHLQTCKTGQTKIIRVISGKVLDFLAEPNDEFEKVFYKEITPKNGWLLIEPHLAHGFYALEKTVFEYFCIGAYAEDMEMSLNIASLLEKEFNISSPFMSSKDMKGRIYGRELINS